MKSKRIMIAYDGLGDFDVVVEDLLDDSPSRIIIGVDGSPEAEAAVSSVARRAWMPGTEV